MHSISNDSATKHIAFHAHGCPILGGKYKTVLITHTSSFTEDKTANIWLESEVANIECPRTNIGPLFRQLEASLLNRARFITSPHHY